jgi:hypothetical protein
MLNDIESNEATVHAAAKLASPAAAKNFMLAGKAIFTLVSLKSGTRYTFKVTHKPASEKYGESWMVSYLTGPDNWVNYSYIGQIKATTSGFTFFTTRASKLTMDSAPVAGFNWAFTHINAGLDTPRMEVWHAGKCGRCGRMLTVPESILSGYGSDCLSRI